jgi:flagellar M-ring protein FliF
MAIVNPENANAAMQGFSRLPIFRQLALMVGLAASIAIGVAVVLWSQTPNYQILFSSLDSKDAAAVTDSLQKANIEYKVDEKSGAIMVPSTDVRDARIKLASQGLPKSTGVGVGFEMMDKDQGFGTSQFMEVARYQRALEGELARSISSIESVQAARVHLAIPKQSVFVRNRQKPTASVVVSLLPGRVLDDYLVAGIVHMVASSVPNLETDNVTVIDQQGRLLSRPDADRALALSASQFDYTQRVEDAYAKRVEDLLTPIAGIGKVRAQVVTDIDFTMQEQTRENFDPNKPALRSEQTAEEQSVGYAGPVGIPGALSNQPPGAATAPETTAAANNPAPVAAGGGAVATAATATAANPGSGTAAAETPMSKSKRATHNYELNKTISHTRNPAGTIRRLSVAVVVDNKQVTSDTGDVTAVPYKPEELTRLTNLVKEAVGFDEKRGDSVSVINAAFIQPQAPAPLPETPLWKQPWLWDVAKQGLGIILVLLLGFGVLRPLLRSLAEKGKEPPVMFAGAEGQALSAGEEPFALSAPAQPKAPDYESDLNTTRSMVAQDPKRVAQVIKTWVGTDGG